MVVILGPPGTDLVRIAASFGALDDIGLHRSPMAGSLGSILDAVFVMNGHDLDFPPPAGSPLDVPAHDLEQLEQNLGSRDAACDPRLAYALPSLGRQPDACVVVIGGRHSSTPASAWRSMIEQALTAAETMPTLVVGPSNGDLRGDVRAFARHTGIQPAVRVAPPKREPEVPDHELDWYQLVLSLGGFHPTGIAAGVLAACADVRSADHPASDLRAASVMRATFDGSILALAAHAPRVAARTRKLPVYAPDLDAEADIDRYERWRELTADARSARIDRARAAIAETHRSARPRFLVLVPTGAGHEDLHATLRSLREQLYEHVEIEVAALNEQGEYRARRAGVIASTRPGGCAAALQHAFDETDATHVVVVQPGDELSPEALLEVAGHLVGTDDDLVYTDEDCINADGRPHAPHFKPDWSPDLARSMPYATRLLAISTEVGRRLGVGSGREGAEVFDLLLRADRGAARIGHVPIVGYHRRAEVGASRVEVTAADLAVVRDDLEAEGVTSVERGPAGGTIIPRLAVTGEPKVTIVVPFRDGADLLRVCVDSTHRTAGYDNYEFVLVDNESWEPETVALLRRLRDDARVRIIEYPAAFNWSAINNLAARESSGDLLLFMNSDIEGRRDGWLAAMVEQAMRPGVGPVGARLLYPDGRVQHGGVVMGLGAWVAWHAFVFCGEADDGYFGHAAAIRNFSAVTGACLMIDRRSFEALGGFDERLAVAFNDVDFCLRAREAGLRSVLTPLAELYHHEGASRGRSARELEETQEMLRRWPEIIRSDPHFNRNLDPARSEFALPLGIGDTDPWETLFALLDPS